MAVAANELVPLPAYALVIPVLDERRCPGLNALLAALSAQSHPPREIHVVVGDRRQGRAINHGVSCAGTVYVGTVDDDTEIDDPELFAKILSVMVADPTIGMAGAACAIPARATPFQQRAMRQIPRRHFPVQSRHLDSDMVQHPCLVMPRELFLAIGGEDEQIIRGLDPVLRKKVRDAGRRVVIVADTYVYHLLPGNLGRLLKMYFRNGRGSAFAARHHPGKVLELTDGFDGGTFTERRSLPYRALRRAGRLLTALVKAEFIRLLVDCAYIGGYLGERVLGSYPSTTAVASIATEIEQRNGCAIHWHRVSSG